MSTSVGMYREYVNPTQNMIIEEGYLFRYCDKSEILSFIENIMILHPKRYTISYEQLIHSDIELQTNL